MSKNTTPGGKRRVAFDLPDIPEEPKTAGNQPVESRSRPTMTTHPRAGSSRDSGKGKQPAPVPLVGTIDPAPAKPVSSNAKRSKGKQKIPKLSKTSRMSKDGGSGPPSKKEYESFPPPQFSSNFGESRSGSGSNDPGTGQGAESVDGKPKWWYLFHENQK